MKRDVVEAIESLLAHRTEDLGCYEFVLEAWMEEAASEINRLRSERRWIPVGERLPEDKEQCLVARGEDVAVAWWHSRPQAFIHEDIDNAWTPTHWMPLPEPPA